MSAQLSLTYKPAHAGGEAWQRQLAILRTIVEHLGRKEVAFELDISGSGLSDALNERDRKRWAAEWTHVVKAMLSSKHDDVSSKLLRELATADIANTSFVLDESIDLTPEEIVAALKRDEDGRAALERVLRKRGRR